MARLRNNILNKYSLLSLVFLGIVFFIYQGCEQSVDQQEDSSTAESSWCRVYTQEEVYQSIAEYEARHGDEGSDNLMPLNIQDFGQISVIEDDGTLQGTPGGIVKTVRNFYSAHPDNFDFVSIYANFPVPAMDDAFAWHIDVKQEVQGIGSGISDISSSYGSSGNLNGLQMMNSIFAYRSDPYAPANQGNNAFEILAHENSHMWAARLKFLDGGNVRRDLLGHQGAHWAYSMDGDSDFLYGHVWQNNGNGTFTDLGACTRYGILTLYTMGMVPAGEVPPFLFIENASRDPVQFCQGPGTNSGTARTLTIQDIINAEGPRIPDYNGSQKSFRMAFILVVAPGQFPPPSSDLAWVDSVRQGYPAVFSDLTLGRGTVVTDISTLAPPSNLHVIKITKDQAFLSGNKIIELAWDQYNNAALQGYNIYRAEDSTTSFRKVNSSPVGSPSFTDEGLDASKQHAYHVTAVLNTGEESPFSNLAME